MEIIEILIKKIDDVFDNAGCELEKEEWNEFFRLWDELKSTLRKNK